MFCRKQKEHTFTASISSSVHDLRFNSFGRLKKSKLFTIVALLKPDRDVSRGELVPRTIASIAAGIVQILTDHKYKNKTKQNKINKPKT